MEGSDVHATRRTDGEGKFINVPYQEKNISLESLSAHQARTQDFEEGDQGTPRETIPTLNDHTLAVCTKFYDLQKNTNSAWTF